MRRFVWLLALLFLLSGCSSKVPEMLPENFDNSGEKCVLYCGEKTFMLAKSVDGVNSMEDGTYWYYELSAQGEDAEALYYTYDLKKHELNGSKTAELLENCYATNGNWPLFLYPVHTEYSESNQTEADSSLRSMVEGTLTDVWECDLNGDGEAETLFCFKGEENIFGYRCGDRFQGVYSGSCETVIPMICDLNGDAVWELLLYTKGDYECFGVFELIDNNFVKRYEILF